MIPTFTIVGYRACGETVALAAFLHEAPVYQGPAAAKSHPWALLAWRLLRVTDPKHNTQQ